MFTTYDSDKRIWSGPQVSPYYHESVSIGRVIYNSLLSDREHIAQISHNNGVIATNGDILDQMLKIACNLKARGFNRNCVIGIMAKNSHLLAPIIFACLSLTIPLHLLHTSLTVEELMCLMKKTRPSIIFCDSKFYDSFKKASKNLKYTFSIVTIDQKLSEVEYIDDYLQEIASGTDVKMEDVNEDTTALILNTSGTTGFPKALKLSHQQILYKILFRHEILGKDIMFLQFFDCAWFCGVMMYIWTTLTRVTRIITTHPFSIEVFFKLMKKYKPDIFFTFPSQVSEILSHMDLHSNALSSLRECIIAGSILSESMYKRFQAFLPNGKIYIDYGLSETCGPVSKYTAGNCSTYSIGKLQPGIQVRIVDDCGTNCPPGKSGEICVKSKFKFLGYYNELELTKELIDEDGWLHTGDGGLIDDQNDLHIIGRIKDIIICCPQNVLPMPIEQLIETHPAVKVACVIGLPHDVYGEIPAAAVIRKKDSYVSDDDIKELVATKLSSQNNLHGGSLFCR
ncbi:hypothetical protein DMENIID0001_153250 [Sergentomyia squamirostris]